MPILSAPLNDGEFPVSYANASATHVIFKSPEKGYFNPASGSFDDAPLDKAKHLIAVIADADLAGLKWACVPKVVVDSGPFSVLWSKLSNSGVPTVLDSSDYGLKGVSWMPPVPPAPPSTLTLSYKLS